MNEVYIDNMTRIGKGGDADIFVIDDNRVLKLYYNDKDHERIKHEFQIIQDIARYDIGVPKVYNMIELNERIGYVMENIHGESLYLVGSRKPWINFTMPSELAYIQHKIHKFKAPDCARSINNILREKIGECKGFPLKLKEFVLTTLDELKCGDKLCHGDFHPSNVMVRDSEYILIDWFDAGAGDPIADVARTMILLKKYEEASKNRIQKYINKVRTNMFAQMYLKAYNKLDHLDMNQLAKWEIVMAAEELMSGCIHFREQYYNFIERCFLNHDRNVILLI